MKAWRLERLSGRLAAENVPSGSLGYAKLKEPEARSNNRRR
jgi:hypothetical protein